MTDLTGGNQKKYFDATLTTIDEHNFFSVGSIGGTGAPIYDIDSMLVNVTVASEDTITIRLYEDINGASVLIKTNPITESGVYSLTDLFSSPSLASDYIAITATSTLGTSSEIAGTIVFRSN